LGTLASFRPGYADGPRLLADIGATHARFTLETAPGVLRQTASARATTTAASCRCCTTYLAEHAYLASASAARRLRHGQSDQRRPGAHDQPRLAVLDRRSAARRWAWSTLLIVNDFTALAMALPGSGRRRDAGRRRQARAARGARRARPGTGLGVSGVIPTADGFVTLGSEGGHVNFAPSDEREFAILQYAWREWKHVSNERICPVPAWSWSTARWRERNGVQAPARTSRRDHRGALEQRDPLCLEVLECFAGMLGTRRPTWPSRSARLAASSSAAASCRASRVVRDLAVPRALRSQRALLGLPGADPDLRDHDAEPGLRGVSTILSEHLRGRSGANTLMERVSTCSTSCRRPSSASPRWCSSIRARCCPSRSPRSRAWPTSASRP
jgi:glucokinase